MNKGFPKTAKCCRRLAFSLVEILVVIGIVGTLAAIGIPMVSGIPEATKKRKLEQDVAMVNNAIDAYIAAGGSPESLNADNVLSVLKGRVYGGVAAEMMGPQGPFISADIATASSDLGWSATFSADPRPRYIVVTGNGGVVFVRGAATGGSDSGAPQSAPTWLWSHADTAPTGTAETIYAPGTIESSGPLFGTTPSAPATRLSSPLINAPLVFDLGTNPVISIANPNSSESSRLVYSVPGGSGLANYEDAFSLTSPGIIEARAISLDPSRYLNSSSAQLEVFARARLEVIAPSSIKYADLGTTNITVISSAEGTPYVFAINYEFDKAPDENTVNVYNGPIPLVAGLWSNSPNITFQAIAKPVTANKSLTNSEVATASIAADSEVLDAPSITPAGQVVFGSIPVTIAKGANNPPNTRVYYTYSADSSVAPTPEAGILYSGPFVVSEFGVSQLKYVKAKAYPPVGLPSFWFEPSNEASETYRGLNFDYYNLEGVLVGGGTIANNAALDGSVVLVSVGGQQPNVTFNNNSVLTGDVYAPGTPSVIGVPSDRIINLDGDPEPSNYTINIQKADFTGKVYRRITPVTMPVVELPTGLTLYSQTVTSGALSPGRYANVDPGNGSTITLGVAGATQPAIYVFDQFDTGNNFSLNVVGPVILTLNPGVGSTVKLGNNVVLGNSNYPERLQINMYTGNFTVGNNSAMYGSILNPNGQVSFEQNAIFVGGVTAKFISILNNAVGVSFSLPPPTVSPTPTPTPTPRPTATP